MPDIDEVINGLEKLQEEISRTKSLWTEPTVGALEDAIELLKQQHGLMLALEQSNASNEYLNNSVSELGETINILENEIERLKEQEAMNVDVFVQWCIDNHIAGDATVQGIKYWVGKFKERR